MFLTRSNVQLVQEDSLQALEVEETHYPLIIDDRGSLWLVVIGVDHTQIQFKVDAGADLEVFSVPQNKNTSKVCHELLKKTQ